VKSMVLAAAAMICAAQAGAVEPGARPLELIAAMADSALKERLLSCRGGPFESTAFSIGHRGAPLRYAEHTRESYVAAAAMGAGIIECDVTFTRDRHQVCRHAQCDLHVTTNILATDLAATCVVPPGPDEEARCCTSDIILAEFKSLCGISDGKETCGTLMSHAESIALFDEFGVGFTPELKSSDVATPDDARLMIEAYVSAGIAPARVWPQSFNLDDVRFWIEHTDYGVQAVYLDGRYEDPAFDHTDPATWQPDMAALREIGVAIIAPPLWMLLALDGDRIVPSVYARAARAAGLKIIAWSLERSGSLETGGGWYYQTVAPVIDDDGDMLRVLDVLARDVGVIGVFSDWPGTVTYYANCLGD
jgi:glycerophosphoryl diester phosphodiesterase